MTQPTTERSEFTRGWPVLLAALIGVACGASPIPFNVFPLVIGPINQEFGWSFGSISLGITVFGVTAALLAPFYGSLADKYGVRPVALASLLAFALAFAAFALTPPSLTGYYGLWLLLGLIGIGSTPVTWSRAINMWFFRNRGLALGIMLLGTSLAALVVPKLAVWAIGEYGWRNAFAIVALLPLLLALPIGVALFREPRADERPAAVAQSVAHGATLPEALRDRRFWILWVSIACVAMAYGGAHIHMAEIVKLHGFVAADAASVMQVVGLAILLGRVITGFLLDKFWAPAVCFPILCLPAISVVLLTGTDPAFARIMVAAFLLGFAAGAESDLIAYLASRYFGMKHYGKIYGMLYMPFGLMSATSPAIYGAVRDAYGNYDPMLWTAGALFVAGGALLLLMGPYPERGGEAQASPQPA
jgi:MFS family permease